MIFKRGQVTIFIILGILIVGTVIAFLAFKPSEPEMQIPVSINPVYISFLSCLEEDVVNGITLLEIQGGYIYMPDFEPGSSYMPFSSQLDFLGNPIPYWYYVSGNNIAKEQVPTVEFMEGELEKFVDEKIRNCVFDSYYENGYEINQGIPKSDVNIRDKNILVNLEMPLNITKANESYLITSHNLEISSNFKKLYDSALEIYNKEQKEMFLENYTVDILRNYAPVDGVELSCAPLTWNAEEVFEELQSAIEANILALKTRGGEYTLSKKENKYFVINTEVNARFLNSKKWPSSFEVTPSKGALLISEPIGNQQGLGIIGFCYVPYHFVYNIKYPVLIQIYEGEEFFQFPFAVVIQGNVPRKARTGEFIEQGKVADFCEYANTPFSVYVTDKRLNPIEANISYECSDTSCFMGETEEGYTKTLFPQCVNGILSLSSSGYNDRRVECTVMEDNGEIYVYMDKLYEKEINLKLDSRNYLGRAIITFTSNDSLSTIVYPEQKKVSLAEGQYEIQVSTYENSSITIPSSTQSQCVDVPKEGLGGLFGMTEEKCFEYEIPSQVVSNALSGGGKEEYYILENELEESKLLEINAYGLPKPSSLEQLQNNYALYDDKGLDILFK